MIDSVKQISWIKGSQPIQLFKHLPKIKAGFYGKQPQPDSLVDINQVHGCNIVEYSENAEQPAADGIFTSKPQTKIAIKTADCLPVLLAHKDQPFVMALHAGWKGLCKRIIQQASLKITESNLQSADFYVSLGPCIGPRSFEVGEEVIEVFLKSYDDFSTAQQNLCISKGSEQKWFLDLAMAASLELLGQGYKAEQISAYRNCTFTEEQAWHSYRKGAKSGDRNYSWIMIQ